MKLELNIKKFRSQQNENLAALVSESLIWPGIRGYAAGQDRVFDISVQKRGINIISRTGVYNFASVRLKQEYTISRQSVLNRVIYNFVPVCPKQTGFIISCGKKKQ